MKRLSIFLLLIFAYSVSAQELPEWVYVLQSDRIVVANVEVGNFDQSINLSRSGAARLHGTPGGKYVFVTFGNSKDVAVVDVETHEEVAIVAFDFEPSHIKFSPMGEKAYITNRYTNEIRVYDHRKAQFTYSSSISKGRVGAPVMLNRRGTRLYRSSDDGLMFIYLKTGEVIEEVQIAGFPNTFSIAPDFRTIWAVSEREGELIIVDESRGRVSRRISLDAAHPADLGTAVFSSSRGVVPTDGKLVVLNTKNYRVQENLDLQEISQRFVISQDGRIWSLFGTGVETLWMDGETEGALTELGAATMDLAYVVVRSGEGFACF